ncbi:hypothetical protein E2C01_026162 [Portunus trituberculatus]|uniref:Uncharacterized protein n=1 Tax=Portunus trituberculatus TaxID=210409 RepID=A0A5B7EF02_PORTR|nr:hypothetical protein [Portunus trituberculatus]
MAVWWSSPRQPVRKKRDKEHQRREIQPTQAGYVNQSRGYDAATPPSSEKGRSEIRPFVSLFRIYLRGRKQTGLLIQLTNDPHVLGLADVTTTTTTTITTSTNDAQHHQNTSATHPVRSPFHATSPRSTLCSACATTT